MGIQMDKIYYLKMYAKLICSTNTTSKNISAISHHTIASQTDPTAAVSDELEFV